MRRIRPRWLILALAALLAAAGAGYASWRAVWADGRLRAARAALAHHDYAHARDECDAYLQVWPAGAEAHLLAARCARHLGAFDAAEQHLNDARRANADAGALEREFALLDVQRGQETAADRLLLQSLLDHNDPESPDIFETVTQSRLFRYRVGDALEVANHWVARRPDDAQAYYLRGTVWEAMQQADKARDDYAHAVALDADHPDAGKRLAEVLLAQNDADEALKQFERLLARTPDDPALQLGAARCRRLLGHTEAAAQMLEALAARQPDNAVVWRERGSVAMDQDHFGEAEGYFRKALTADPFDDVACNKLAACLRRLDRPVEADELTQRAKGIEDDVSRLQFLTEEVERRQADPAPRCEAGVICMRNGQEQEGLRWLLGALHYDPHHKPTRDALADYYERHGDAKAAAEYREP